MLENRDSFVAKNNYYKLKQKLEKVEFNFIECSMIELSNFIGDKNYAAIYLSNIAEYLKDIYKANRLTQFKQFILDDLYSHLDDNGLLVGAYLFNILGGISDIDIYNPQKREKHLSDIFKMITFPSAMCFPYESTHGALVLTKKYNNRSNNAYN
jgi:hypothetical protein